MKKINFGKLAVDNLKQDEVIEWIDNSIKQVLTNFNDGIAHNSIGEMAVATSSLALISGVAQALNEDVNGKKEPTVV